MEAGKLMKPIMLSDGESTITIRPDLGAGLERYDFQHVPMFRPAPPGTTDPFQLAMNVLVPWSNRISGGGFAYGGMFHRLSPNVAGEAYPIHGFGFSEAWLPSGQTGTSADFVLVYKGPGPYAFRLPHAVPHPPGQARQIRDR